MWLWPPRRPAIPQATNPARYVRELGRRPDPQDISGHQRRPRRRRPHRLWQQPRRHRRQRGRPHRQGGPRHPARKPLGVDMQRGWELWLKPTPARRRRPVDTVLADEGETPQTGVPAVQKVLQSDGVDIVVGLVSSATALGVGDLLRVQEAADRRERGGGGRHQEGPHALHLALPRSPTRRWRRRWAPPRAVRLHRRVYAIAPDYAAGSEVIAGFRTASRRAAGRSSARPSRRSARRRTTSRSSPGSSRPGPRPPSASSPGPRRSASSSSTTVRAVLDDPALRVRLPHRGQRAHPAGRRRARRPDRPALQRQLDTPANKAFVEAYRSAYGESPSCFAVQAWDAAKVLNRAVGAARPWTATAWPPPWAASGHHRQPARPVDLRGADPATEHLPAQGGDQGRRTGQLRLDLGPLDQS